MRSRITIDFNESNEPVIKIDYLASTDVRDKMVKRFLEKFGDSAWARFKFSNSTSEAGPNTSTLTPIPIGGLFLEVHPLIDDAKAGFMINQVHDQGTSIEEAEKLWNTFISALTKSK